MLADLGFRTLNDRLQRHRLKRPVRKWWRTRLPQKPSASATLTRLSMLISNHEPESGHEDLKARPAPTIGGTSTNF